MFFCLKYNVSMNLYYNKEKLNKTLQTFNVLTNANICVFDCDFTPIASAGEFPCFCYNIRKKNKLEKKCIISDMLFADQCVKNKTSITYTCHAGIVETISPIFFEDVLIGYIIFGGLRDLEDKFSNEISVKKACELYNLNFLEFLSYYNEIPSFTHKQLEAYLEVLKLSIKNILVENLLMPNPSLYATKILTYLHNNYDKSLKICDLCKEFNMSEKTLYKIVKQITNKTINEYITCLRIEKAKRLLNTTDLPISEIAYLVGYTDYNYFIRVFKKQEKLSPLKYKKLKA